MRNGLESPGSELLTPPDTVGTSRSVFRRGHDRRATYCLTLPLAAVAVLGSLVLTLGNSNLYDGLALPLLTLALLVLWILACTRRATATQLDVLVLIAAWSFVLGRLGFSLFAPELPDRDALIAATAPWIPVLLITHAWGLGERRGLRLSLLALTLTLLLVITAALAAPTLQLQSLNPLFQMLLAGGVAIISQRAALRQARQHSGQRGWLATRGAQHDPLTGLPNGQAVQHLLGTLTRRRPAGLAVAVVRLDHLARLQTQRGPVFLQQLTAHVARTLSATVRDQDVVGRLNDTDFLLLLRVPDVRAARAACERLRVRVASLPLEGIIPTISVGVTVWSPHRPGQDMLEDAARAMRQAQTDGHNRVQVADGLRSSPDTSSPS